MGARPPVGNLVTQALGRGSILGLVFLPGLNCIQLNCSLAPSRRRLDLQVSSMPWNAELDWPSVKCGGHTIIQVDGMSVVSYATTLTFSRDHHWHGIGMPCTLFCHSGHLFIQWTRRPPCKPTAITAAEQMSFSHFGGDGIWSSVVISALASCVDLFLAVAYITCEAEPDVCQWMDSLRDL